MSDVTYPAELEIAPLTKPVSAAVTVPGSKSITNRALVLATLSVAEKGTTLRGVLRSEDTEVMIECLRWLGFVIDTDWDQNTVWISPEQDPRLHRKNDLIPAESADLFVGNSGTTVRFLTAAVALGQGTYRLDGIPRMRERPIKDLLDALQQLGVNAYSEHGNGCPPVVVQTTGLRGGRVRVKGDVSSQFLSALIMAAPFADGDSDIEVDGPLVSEPYIAMTFRMLQDFGLKFEVRGPGNYHIFGDQYLGVTEYAIEPDASAASYFWAAAAIAGGRITVTGLNRKSLQGDVRFVDVLAQMGCQIEEGDNGITVHGGRLRGVDVDMNDISDTVMTLGAVACFAEGPTTIRNVGHIRHKETDRIAALATELRKFGAEVEERDDGLTIVPRPLKGCAVDTYNDHRMAMSLALVGLKVPGVVIRNPGCVVKTYPGFWQDLELLRG
ncbi:3-phosphoshikimate 1-carboxyvinyltransferase [Gemmata sp. G18]|uniref:3-phosphoshikimate 1-carboxyvinyltransferase n=1 Tax=Gemmata palustris TaxID=2822762 RepID=A0ABS5C082_9BACT|nr:3-phosphoshikimate 1-carboxyvinyltransferase [Gemmata palustris]MBP3959401.1 3-phosphoshikimate 1-carboxyvinyltransferase [Gemmata palustris]